MKVTLDGKELELEFTHGIMREIEKQIISAYAYPDKCIAKTVTSSDVVAIYYNAQKGTAYNEQHIFDMVAADGLVFHITQTFDVIMRFISGARITKQLEEEAGKKQ